MHILIFFNYGYLTVKNKRTWKKQHASFFWGWWVDGWVPTFLKDIYALEAVDHQFRT